MKMLRIMLAAGLCLAAPTGPAADLADLGFDPVAMAEGVPLMMKGMEILSKVANRVSAHAAALAAKGLAEEPLSKAAVRYRVDLGLLGTLEFDDWGELFIDRRFVTAEEERELRKIEAYAWTHVIEPMQAARILPGGKPKPGAAESAVATPSMCRLGVQ